MSSWKKAHDFPAFLSFVVVLVTVTIPSSFALIADNILSRITSRKLQTTTTATTNSKKLSPKKMLTVLTTEYPAVADTPRTVRRTFMNSLSGFLSPGTFYRTHVVAANDGTASVGVNPLFSPLKSVDDLFKSPRLAKFISSLSSPRKAQRATQIDRLAQPLRKLADERDAMRQEVKEVAVRGLMETVLFDLLTGLMQDGPSYVDDPVLDTEHLSLKMMASDFITGGMDKRQVASVIVRELSSPTEAPAAGDTDSDAFMPFAVAPPDNASSSGTTTTTTLAAVRAHLFAVKLVLRYVLMPMLVRGVAHTVPAMSFHFVENELKLMGHMHHLFF